MKIRYKNCREQFSIKLRDAIKKHKCPHCSEIFLPRFLTLMDQKISEIGFDARRGFSVEFYKIPKPEPLTFWQIVLKWWRS